MLLLCGLAHGFLLPQFFHQPSSIKQVKGLTWMCQVSPVASAVVNKWSFKASTAVFEGSETP